MAKKEQLLLLMVSSQDGISKMQRNGAQKNETEDAEVGRQARSETRFPWLLVSYPDRGSNSGLGTGLPCCIHLLDSILLMSAIITSQHKPNGLK